MSKLYTNNNEKDPSQPLTYNVCRLIIEQNAQNDRISTLQKTCIANNKIIKLLEEKNIMNEERISKLESIIVSSTEFKMPTLSPYITK